MSLPKIYRDLFENSGAGPLLREDILPFSPGLPASLFNTTVITTSGNFVVPATGWYKVFVLGGGGPGGFVGVAVGNWAAGGGGGSGAWVEEILYLVEGTVIPVTVGAGGIGTQAGFAVGGPSRFGDLLYASGGNAGRTYGTLTNSNQPILRDGGPSSGPGSNFGGSASLLTFANNWSSQLTFTNGIVSGSGAGSPRGKGGNGVTSNPNSSNADGTRGNDGTGNGAGGSGGVQNKVSASQTYAGGNGSPGCVEVTLIIPATSIVKIAQDGAGRDFGIGVETWTGNWYTGTDGVRRKLYHKTIDIGSGPTGGGASIYKDVPTGIDNIAEVISIRGMERQPDGTSAAIPSYDGSTYLTADWRPPPYNVIRTRAVNNRSNFRWVVQITYTCTDR